MPPSSRAPRPRRCLRWRRRGRRSGRRRRQGQHRRARRRPEPHLHRRRSGDADRPQCPPLDDADDPADRRNHRWNHRRDQHDAACAAGSRRAAGSRAGRRAPQPATARTAQTARIRAQASGRYPVGTVIVLARQPVKTSAGVTVRWRATTESRKMCTVRTVKRQVDRHPREARHLPRGRVGAGAVGRLPALHHPAHLPRCEVTRGGQSGIGRLRPSLSLRADAGPPRRPPFLDPALPAAGFVQSIGRRPHIGGGSTTRQGSGDRVDDEAGRRRPAGCAPCRRRVGADADEMHRRWRTARADARPHVRATADNEPRISTR